MIKRFLLATDFGGAGPYQGQLRTVLAELAPGVPVIDLVADLVPFRPDLAGYLLPHLLRDLPADNLVLAVVDPGVGGERDVLVLQTERNWFVAPDNGLLSQVARRAGRVRWWRVDWRPQRLSASFHGRDLFAPVAARIAVTGEVPGQPADGGLLHGADWPAQSRAIIYQDRYGNLCSGLQAGEISSESRLIAAGLEIPRARTFCDLPPGTAFWYENSLGLVEIAVNLKHAGAVLGLKPGDLIQVADGAGAP